MQAVLRESRGSPPRAALWPREWVVVGGLAVLAFAVRVVGIRQSLFGDELYSYEIVSSRGIAGVFDGISRTENTPPLYYVLAWVTAKLGDATVTLRIPSLLASTLTVPLTYVLGRKTVGRPAALIGASFMALSPFAIFYASEARAYALATCLVVASTVVLVEAVRRPEARWWLLYAALGAAALYSHYTAGPALAAQALWAVFAHPDRFRQLAAANALIAVSFVPWILHAQESSLLSVIGLITPMTLSSIFEFARDALIGYPYGGEDAPPGHVGVVILEIALAVAACAAVAGAVRRRGIARPTSGAALLGAIAIATPAGLIVYGLVSEDIYISRNLLVSAPAAFLLAGVLIARLPRPVAIATGGACLTVMAVGTAMTLDSDWKRPPFNQAADFIDADARPADVVLASVLFDSPGTTLSKALAVNLRKPHTLFAAGGEEEQAWRSLGPGRQAYVVLPQVAGRHATPSLPARARQSLRFREERVYRGFIPVAVYSYSARPGWRGLVETKGRTHIELGPTRRLRVVPGSLGYLERVQAMNSRQTLLTGWAAGSRAEPAVSRVLAFSDGALIGTTRPNRRRPDVAAGVGPHGLRSGYRFTVPYPGATELFVPTRLRVFGVVGKHATELGWLDRAAEP